MTDNSDRPSSTRPDLASIPRSVSAPWPLPTLRSKSQRAQNFGSSRSSQGFFGATRSASTSRIHKQLHRGLEAALVGTAISEPRPTAVCIETSANPLVLPPLVTNSKDFDCVLNVKDVSASPTQRLGALSLTAINEEEPPARSATEIALACPEILNLILQAVDDCNEVPHEQSQKRRKPMSLRHAQVIYGQNDETLAAWQRVKEAERAIPIPRASNGAGMYSCLTVSRRWNYAASQILAKRIYFDTNSSWHSFVRQNAAIKATNEGNEEAMFVCKPKQLVLHRISGAQRIELDHASIALGGALELLELYTCPGLSPSTDLLRGGMLKKIVLPGCVRVNDRTLSSIAKHCPLLEHLDLRACEQVSDAGIKVIARYCPNLALLNVGRTHGGELVTYKGVKHLARQTQLSTLGVAGCAIDDRAIWELALNRGPALLRLSLNNCLLLTDASVPRAISYMPNLSVLELRGCTQIMDMKPLVLFKRLRDQQGHPPLIEGCEIIERRLQNAILLFRQELSRRVLADCALWLQEPDTDLDFASLKAKAISA